MSPTYDLTEERPFAKAYESKSFLLQSGLLDPSQTAGDVRKNNEAVIALMKQPGMERVVPRGFQKVVASGSSSASPDYLTSAGSVRRLVDDRVSEFGRQGVVTFEASALKDPADPGYSKLKAELVEKSEIAASLTSREPEVHNRIISTQQATALSVGYALAKTGYESQVFTGTGQEKSAREGYIYGAVSDSHKREPAMFTTDGRSIIPEKVLEKAGLDFVPKSPENIDKVRQHLPEDAHVLVASQKHGAENPTIIIGLPAQKVEKTFFKNGDGELELRPGRNASGQQMVLATKILSPEVSIHGGHELPKVQPSFKTTHVALELGRPATSADIAAITAGPSEPALMSFNTAPVVRSASPARSTAVRPRAGM